MFKNFDLRKVVLALASFLILGVGSAMTARADTFQVVGNTNPNATATINIISLSNTQLVFTVTNTMSVGVVSAVAFDVAGTPNFTGSVGVPQPGSQNFSFVTSTGNIPQFNSADPDFAFVTHVNNNGTGNFAGSNPPKGIQVGATSSTFTVTGDFTGFTQQMIADAVYVRFQALGGKDDSDVGHGGNCVNCPNQIPEPTTMLLLGSGLAGLAAKVRSRRKAAKE